MKIAYLLKTHFVIENRIPDGIDIVRIEVGDDGLYSAEDLVKVRDVEAFVIGKEPVHEQILAAAPKLKIVQRLGAGYETLDLEQLPSARFQLVTSKG